MKKLSGERLNFGRGVLFNLLDDQLEQWNDQEVANEKRHRTQFKTEKSKEQRAKDHFSLFGNGRLCIFDIIGRFADVQHQDGRRMRYRDGIVSSIDENVM
jgi:hypothetical protein